METSIEIQENKDLLFEELIEKYRIDSLNREKTLKEELLTEFDWELVLLALGFIPIIGEVFDTILIIKYFKERRWIEAFIMMVALIPVVGDIAVKPFLFAGRGLKAFTSTGKFMKILQNNPKFRAMYIKASKYFGSPQVAKLGKQIAKKEPGLAADIKKSGQFHINAMGKIKAGAKMTKGLTKGPLAKGVLKRKPRTGFGFATQQRFRNSAIKKFVAKNNRMPGNGLESWFHVVYKGRAARRTTFRKALVTSNLLGILGLPNLESFEDYISTPEGAEDVMNDPAFQEFYNSVTTDADEGHIENYMNRGGEAAPEESSFDMDAISIPMMKKFAAMVA